MHETTVILAEKDSEWLRWANASRKPEHALVLMVQDDDESQSTFFDRVRRGFDHIRDEATRIDRVVISAGSQWDKAKLQARTQMVQDLLKRTMRAPTTKVLIGDRSKLGTSPLAA